MSLLEFGKTALASQPFSVLIGAQLGEINVGRVELSLPISKTLTQERGYVHGGVISYMADNALTFAAASTFGPDVVTSEMKINYLRPVTGSSLLARAVVVHAGKRQAVCRCDLFVEQNGAKLLCAVAQGTIARLNPDSASQARDPATRGG